MGFFTGRRAYAPTALTALALLCAHSASAQVSNGSFEQGGGSFASWVVSGDGFIADSSLGSGPTDGSFDALLSTATDGSGGVVPPGNGVSPAALETNLNLTLGSLSNVGNGTAVIGSAITQVVTLNVGDTLSFDWDFLTNQAYDDGTGNAIPPSLNNDDYSFVSIAPVGPASSSVTKLADIFAPNTITPSLNNPYIAETGFKTFSWVAPTTGQYLLGIGVVHMTIGQEDGVNSGLLVDNVKVAAVPEPLSCLALAGMFGTFAMSRRRRGAQKA